MYHRQYVTKHEEAEMLKRVMDSTVEEAKHAVLNYAAIHLHEPWILPGLEPSHHKQTHEIAKKEMEKHGATLIKEVNFLIKPSDDNPQKKLHQNSGEIYTFAETARFVFEEGGCLKFAINMWEKDMVPFNEDVLQHNDQPPQKTFGDNDAQDQWHNSSDQDDRTHKRKRDQTPSSDRPSIRYMKFTKCPFCLECGSMTYDSPEYNPSSKLWVCSNGHEWPPTAHDSCYAVPLVMGNRADEWISSVEPWPPNELTNKCTE